MSKNDDDRPEWQKKAGNAALISGHLADLAKLGSQMSDAAKYRGVKSFDTGKVSTNAKTGTMDRTKDLYPTSKQQTTVREDNGTDINGKSILTEKEKKQLLG